jgi:hypothetical protein
MFHVRKSLKITELTEEAEGYKPNLEKELFGASGTRPFSTNGIPLASE